MRKLGQAQTADRKLANLSQLGLPVAHQLLDVYPKVKESIVITSTDRHNRPPKHAHNLLPIHTHIHIITRPLLHPSHQPLKLRPLLSALIG
jgi:hypothetical protein